MVVAFRRCGRWIVQSVPILELRIAARGEPPVVHRKMRFGIPIVPQLWIVHIAKLWIYSYFAARRERTVQATANVRSDDSALGHGLIIVLEAVGECTKMADHF